MQSEWNQIKRFMRAIQSYRPKCNNQLPPEQVGHSVVISDCVLYLKSIDDESVDLIFTDEPYGAKPTALSHSDIRGFYEHINVDWSDDFPSHLAMPWVPEAARVLKPGGMLINSGFPEWGTTFKEVVRLSGLDFRGTIPWLKPGGVQMRRVNYKSSFEVIWWASKGSVKDTFNFQEQMEMRNWQMETICPKCKIYHPVLLSNEYSCPEWAKDIEWPEFMFGVNDRGERVNETQKPEWLAQKLLTIHSSKGDLVLDPFCGSGTYLAVAHQMGRKVGGCDIRESQVIATRSRIEKSPRSLFI